MSESNGTATKPRTIESVREEYRLARLETRLAEARVEKQLLESFAVPDPWLSPWQRDPEGWRQIGQVGRPEDRRQSDNGPLVANEAELDALRGRARVLASNNPIAVGALRNLGNFTIKTGYTFRAEPEPEADPEEAKTVAALVQVCIDEFVDINSLNMRQKKAFTRSVRDGSVLWRYFAIEDGKTKVRAVEPEQLRRPDGTTAQEWSWGIHTDPDDVETVIEYAVHPMDGGQYDTVPADQIDHMKRNVDESAKVGLSDFYCVGESLDGTLKLLRNMRVGESVRAAIVGFWEYETANRDQVSRAIAAARDVSQPNGADSPSGRPYNYQHFPPGSIPHTPKSRKFVAAPANEAIAGRVGVLQANLRAIGIRWSMPEYLISGDASNNAYASSLVAGSPFVVAIETEQDEYRTFFLSAVWRAIKNYAAVCRFRIGGKLYGYDEIKRLVQIVCEVPQVANVDRLQVAQISEIELRNGITSMQKWRGKSGYDNDQIKKDLQEEPVEQPQTGLPFPGPVLPGDPAPTPAPTPTGTADAIGGVTSTDLRATVGGSQAVAELQRAYYKGELPRAAAIANAVLVFGFDKAEAEQLFPDVAPTKLTPPEETKPDAPTPPLGEGLQARLIDLRSRYGNLSDVVAGAAAVLLEASRPAPADGDAK